MLKKRSWRLQDTTKTTGFRVEQYEAQELEDGICGGHGSRISHTIGRTSERDSQNRL